MRRLCSLLSGIACAAALVLATRARAETRDVGNIAVVEDVTNAIIYPPEDAFWGPDMPCRETAKLFYRTHCDDYDVLVVSFIKSRPEPFLDNIRNVQQGTPVRNDVRGIGFTTWNWTSLYGSRGRLEQCVSMAALASIPNDPNGPATALFGLPLGITGVELLGHEFGHRYLVPVTFDKNDGRGAQHFLRGYESDSPNLHYSAYANSQSVMYGSFITPQQDGSYRMCGGERKYSHLDQYLMGLRAAADVAPMMVLDDGSGQGSPAVPQSRGVCSTLSGSTYRRVDVAIEDVVRSMGPRVPAAADARKTWRVAFVLLTEQGTAATPAQIAKMEAYRTRFTSWFQAATDGLGTVDTTLAPPTCVLPDGGVRDGGLADGGLKPPEDGGADAGTSRDGGGALDAGTFEDAGAPDGGVVSEDAGAVVQSDAGAADAGGVRRDGGTGVRNPSEGCGCSTDTSGAGAQSFSALALLLVFLRLFAARVRRQRAR